MLLTRRQSLMAGASFLATAWAAKNVLAQGEVSGAQKDAIDKVLRQAVERGDVPGVVVAVTDRERTIYEGAFGERGLGGGVPMTTDTVFYLASMTKPITATCAMQLVEQGKLELDAPISKYVPETKQKLQVLEGWDDKGQPKLRPPKREITLRDLNTHSSGFVYNLWDADFDRYMKETKLPGLDSGKEEAWYPPLMFDPGARWEYGISIDWIGRLVQVVSGKSLGTYMQDHVFAPLGMTSTGYAISPDMEPRRATSHQRDAAGKLAATDWKSKQDPPVENGGGGLYSTTGDYQRFMRMILNKGKGDDGVQLLKAADGRGDDPQQHGRHQGGDAEDHQPRPLARRRVLPRPAQELGSQLHDQRRAGPDRPARRQPRLGRHPEHLLLDRPEDRDRRGLHDPDPAVRGREGPGLVLRVRDGGLSVGELSKAGIRACEGRICLRGRG